MARKIVIDVEARFKDEVTDEAKTASDSVDNLNKKKAKPTVDADSNPFLKKMREAEKRAKDFGKKTASSIIDAKDKASAIFGKAMAKAKAYAGKTWSAIVAAKDKASSILSKVTTLGKGIAGKTWSAIVKVKDYAMTPLKKIKDALFSIKSLAAAVFAGFAAKQLVVNPISTADAYSSARIGFQTLLGEQQGQQMMDDLDVFAKATPFKTNEVIAQSQKMLAMGWNANDILPDMQTIGDAAAATGKGEEGLQRIVLALSQIKSKGKLSTEELNQLAEAGISAKRYLAEGLGYGSGDAGLAAMTKDLERGAIGADTAVQALLEGMKEYNGMMEKTANETVSGLWSQIQDTFEINILRRWGQGLQDGAKRGFGAIVDLLGTADDALADFGDTIYEVGKSLSNWAADKLEKAVKTIKEVTQTDAFKNASLGGKIKILWDEVVAEPFSKWWNGSGKKKVAEIAGSLGKAIGTGITGGLLALLGITNEDALADGVSIGGSFVEGFLEGFDTEKITKALKEWASENKGLAATLGTILGVKLLSGIGSAWTNIKGLFPGKGGSGGLGGIGGSSFATATMDVTAGVVNVYGTFGGSGTGTGGTGWFGTGNSTTPALPGTGSSTPALPGTGSGTPLLPAGAGASAGKVLPGVILKDGTVATASSGLTAGLAKFGVSLGSGATTAGGAAAAGAASTGGILGLITGGISAGVDIFQGVKKGKAGDKKGAKDEYFSAGTKGGMMAAGAGIGAAIGSIIPGAGTAVGALVGGGIGGIVGTFTGDKAGKALSDGTDEGGWMSNAWESTKGFFTDSIPAAFDTFKEKASTFFTETIPEGWNSLWDSVGGFFTETVPAAWGTLTEKVSTFFTETVPEAWNSFWSSVGDFFTETVPFALGYATGKVWTFFSETIPEAWNNFWDTVGAFFTETVPQYAGYIWGKVTTFFTETLPSAWNSFWDAVGSFFTETIPGWADTIWNGYVVPFFTETLPAAWDSFWAAIGTFFTETVPTWAETTWNDRIVPFFTESIPQFFSDLWDSIKTFFTESIPTWAEETWSGHIVPFFTESIPQWFSNLWDSIKSLFNEAVDGFVQNIWSPISTFFTETIPGWVSSVWDKVTGWFGDIKENFLSGFSAGSGEGGGGKKARGGVVGGGSTALEAFARGGNTREAFARGGNTLEAFARGGIVGDTTSRTEAFARGGVAGNKPNRIEAFANGGMVKGSTRFIRVNEEAPEMIIPLSSQRRDRGMKLWAKTGQLLGVPGFARGGNTSGGNDEGIRFRQYGDSSEPVGGKSIVIEVGGIHVEIVVHGNDKESIVEQIKQQAKEIAEVVAGEIADALGGQFDNTPVRGGAA